MHAAVLRLRIDAPPPGTESRCEPVTTKRSSAMVSCFSGSGEVCARVIDAPESVIAASKLARINGFKWIGIGEKF